MDGFKLRVTIATEDSVVLEQFIVIEPGNTVERVAARVRDHIERTFEVYEHELTTDK